MLPVKSLTFLCIPAERGKWRKKKAPLVTMFTSCVCIGGNLERFAGRRGGSGCSGAAARHALDHGSCGTSLQKAEFLRGISLISPPFVSLSHKSPPDIQVICRVHTLASYSPPWALPVFKQESKPQWKSPSCASTLLCVFSLSSPSTRSQWSPSNCLPFWCSD